MLCCFLPMHCRCIQSGAATHATRAPLVPPFGQTCWTYVQCRQNRHFQPAALFAPLLPDLLDETDVELMQNMSCKVDAATLKPAQYPTNPELEW